MGPVYWYHEVKTELAEFYMQYNPILILEKKNKPCNKALNLGRLLLPPEFLWKLGACLSLLGLPSQNAIDGVT